VGDGHDARCHVLHDADPEVLIRHRVQPTYRAPQQRHEVGIGHVDVEFYKILDAQFPCVSPVVANGSCRMISGNILY
jgi:hypothetical protein